MAAPFLLLKADTLFGTVSTTTVTTGTLSDAYESIYSYIRKQNPDIGDYT